MSVATDSRRLSLNLICSLETPIYGRGRIVYSYSLIRFLTADLSQGLVGWTELFSLNTYKSSQFDLVNSESNGVLFMKFRWLSAAVCTATLGLATLISPNQCQAQAKSSAPKAAATAVADETEDEAVVVVAINSIDSLLPNVQHVARLVGAGAAVGGVSSIVNQFVTGLDKARPFGVFVNLDENGQPSFVGCLPIEDLEQFFEQLGTVIGEPNDLGDGLYELGVGGNTIYAKKIGKWLYVGQTEESLDDLPENMADVLPKMIQKYDIRIQVNPQNIPDELVEFLMAQAQEGLDRGMEQSGNVDPADAESTREASEKMMEQMQEAIEGTEKLVIGLAINKQEKRTVLDFGSQFVADSKYAKQIEKLKSSKTAVAGIPQDGSMMIMQAFQLVATDEIEQIEKSLDVGLKTALKDADENMKKLAEEAVDILVESAKLGKMESAVDVSVESSLNIVTSVSVADGAKIEALAVKIAAELVKEKSPVQLKINSGKYAGFNLHSGKGTLPPQAPAAVKKIFGDAVTIAIATGPKSVHIAVGKNCDASVKSAIDRAAAKPSAPAEAFKMRLVLSQLLNYIQSIEASPVSEAMLNAVSAAVGNDRIMIDSTSIERGVIVRLSLEDGVMKAIAAGVKAGQTGGGF